MSGTCVGAKKKRQSLKFEMTTHGTDEQHWLEKIHPPLLALLAAYRRTGDIKSSSAVWTHLPRFTIESFNAILLMVAPNQLPTSVPGPDSSEDEIRAAAFLASAKLLGNMQISDSNAPPFAKPIKTFLNAGDEWLLTVTAHGRSRRQRNRILV
jgi:hypothetical protein